MRQHVTETHFLHSHLDSFFPPDNKRLSPLNIAEVSIKLFNKLKGNRVENAVQVCWRTAARFL
jgi:hypothetical protein